MLQNAFWFIAIPIGVLGFTVLSIPHTYAQTDILYSYTASSTWFDIGESTFTQQHDFGINGVTPTNTGYLCSIDLEIQVNAGTPTDKLTLYFYNSGTSAVENPSPTNTANATFMASTSLNAANLISSSPDRFTFSNCLYVQPGNYYEIWIHREMAEESDTDNYEIRIQTSASGNFPKASTFTAGAWTFVTPSPARTWMIWNGYTSLNVEEEWLFTSTTIPSSGIAACQGQSYMVWYDPATWFTSSTLRMIGCVTFSPESSALNFFNEKLENFRGVFPFSLFFQFNTLAQVAITNKIETQSLVFPIQIPGHASTTITILSASSVNSLVGEESVNLWFELQKYIAWAIVMFLAIKMGVFTFKK